jgi:hypothetical protein
MAKAQVFFQEKIEKRTAQIRLKYEQLDSQHDLDLGWTAGVVALFTHIANTAAP